MTVFLPTLSRDKKRAGQEAKVGFNRHDRHLRHSFINERNRREGIVVPSTNDGR